MYSNDKSARVTFISKDICAVQLVEKNISNVLPKPSPGPGRNTGLRKKTFIVGNRTID